MGGMGKRAGAEELQDLLGEGGFENRALQKSSLQKGI